MRVSIGLDEYGHYYLDRSNPGGSGISAYSAPDDWPHPTVEVSYEVVADYLLYRSLQKKLQRQLFNASKEQR